MIFKQLKLNFQILFALSVIFVLLMAFSFWDGYIDNNISTRVWPFIYLLLSLLSLVSLLLFHRKTRNIIQIEDEIKQKVEEERIKILSELNKNKEVKEEIEDNKEELESLLNKIVPQGKFKDLNDFVKKLFSNLAKEIELLQGMFYIADNKNKKFKFLSGYAITSEEPVSEFALGENLNGQAAQTQELMVIDEIPEDYFNVESGLGKSKPTSLIIVPLVDKKKTIALLELAVFIEIQEKYIKLISAISKTLAEKIIQIQKS